MNWIHSFLFADFTVTVCYHFLVWLSPSLWIEIWSLRNLIWSSSIQIDFCFVSSMEMQRTDLEKKYISVFTGFSKGLWSFDYMRSKRVMTAKLYFRKNYCSAKWAFSWGLRFIPWKKKTRLEHMGPVSSKENRKDGFFCQVVKCNQIRQGNVQLLGNTFTELLSYRKVFIHPNGP